MDTTEDTIEPNGALFDALDATPSRPHRPGALRTRTKILLGGIALLALAAASGVAYEALASKSDATSYPMPGRLVDVGSHKMHLYCEGTGTPAIVLDAGLGGASPVWGLVQTELARTTKVCSFDRAGMGWSEMGPSPRTPQQNANELYRLLEAGDVTGPYILVGHSLAGKNDRLLAAAHPETVAGMVLVDARSEQLDIGASKEASEGFRSALDLQAALYGAARRLGLVRLLGAGLWKTPLLTPEAALEMALLETAPDAIATTTAEGRERGTDDAHLATGTLGDMPLVVIAAADSMSNIPNWPTAQQDLAGLSPNGRLIIAEDSGHAVQLDRPDVVIDATLSVLAAARERN
jgi:pimeloyl-ACP methyl ester carboxylesterase